MWFGAVVNDEEQPTPPRKRLFKKRWLTGAAVAVLAGAAWLAREPIADEVIRDHLDNLDVPARYRIDSIGFQSERISDVVIGDPARPDLTADQVEVRLGYGWSGPYVSGIRATGVRLYGRFVDGQLSFGTLDRFRDPDDTTPFALPDIAVALTDARARIETPWGNVGAQLNGSGNLRNDFMGRLALVAPNLTVGDCAAREVTFYGALLVRDVRPTLQGPLRGSTLRCADNGLRAERPQIALDVSLSEQLTSWKGRADASIARLVGAGVTASRLGVLASFEGDATRTRIDAEADIERLAGADFTVRTAEMTAEIFVGRAPPAASGRLTFADAAASPALRRSIAESGRGLAGTPIGPVAEKAVAAVSRMLAGTVGEAGFALAGEGKSARIELIAPKLSSPGGARVTGGTESRVGYLLAADRPAFLVNGRWTFGGGGLPDGNIDLDRRADGTMRGTATIAPYVSDNARLALSPISFSGGRDALLHFATTAELTGPLGDGRAERLRLRLAGVLAPDGSVALDGGCSRASVQRVDVAGFRLAPTAIDLCSRRGAPLLSAGPGGVRGQVNIPAIALRGTSGTSPFAFDGGRAAIDLASMRWTLADADLRLGEGDGATLFAAEQVAGAAARDGMTGRLSGARAKIGAVPLLMSQIAGDWRWAEGAFDLDGELLLTDAETDARFSPLVSTDAHLRFADGVVDANAAFNERATGRKILDTIITHRLESGTGAADLKIDELRFDEGFQPDQLTNLALGVIANVRGSVVGDGRIEWTPDGVTSRGTFATANADLAAAFGPVKGLTTTLTFEDLLGIRSAPGQIAEIVEINPGIPVRDGRVEYRLLGGNRVRIEGGSWPFGGGQLVLHPATLDFSADQPRRLSFDIVGVDAAVFLQQFGFENINATGTFDGTLPVEFDGLGGRIVGGRIDSRAGGGTLAYVGELSNRNLGAIANFAFGALRSLKYDDLTIILNGDLDGEMVTDIRFGGVGQGAGATRNFLTEQVAKIPLVFNVKITAPFRQLLTSAKGFYDPSLLIEQNLPTLLRAQEEAENAADSPVQPTESEPMP